MVEAADGSVPRRGRPGYDASMVLRRASLLMAAGLVIGGIGAWALSANVQSLLFETQSNDPRIIQFSMRVEW